MKIIHVLHAALQVQLQVANRGLTSKQSLVRTAYLMCMYLYRAPIKVAQQVDEGVPPEDSYVLASQCKALMLEVIRRAAHDYVLYRNTRRPERAYALDAYVWLFEEDEEHIHWKQRQAEGEPLMAFLNICEILDLDPEEVRTRVRKMTIKDIMMSGRPAESRKNRQEGVEDFSSPSGIDLYALEEPVAQYQ